MHLEEARHNLAILARQAQLGFPDTNVEPVEAARLVRDARIFWGLFHERDVRSMRWFIENRGMFDALKGVQSELEARGHSTGDVMLVASKGFFDSLGKAWAAYRPDLGL